MDSKNLGNPNNIMPAVWLSQQRTAIVETIPAQMGQNKLISPDT